MILSLSFALTACGKDNSMETQSSDSSNTETETSSVTLDEQDTTGEGEALVTMPDACYEVYETSNVPVLTKHPEYQWDESQLLLINPLGLTLEHSQMLDKLNGLAPFLGELAEKKDFSYKYEWNYETDEAEAMTEPLAFMEGSKTTWYSRYEEEIAGSQSLLFLTYDWDSRISDDPIGVNITVSPGVQSIMTAKDVIKNSLTDTMYSEFIDAVLDEKGEVNLPEDETSYPLASDFLLSEVAEELKNVGESSFRVTFDRDAEYPTGPYTSGLYPSLSTSVKVEDTEMEDLYRTFSSGMATYEMILEENNSPIDITKCIPSVSLANHGQALWDIFSKYTISGEKVIPKTASLDGAVGEDVQFGKTESYNLALTSMGIVNERYLIGGGVTYGLSQGSDGNDVMKLDIYFQDVLEAETDRDPTKEDFDKGVQIFCNMYQEILPELSVTAQDFQDNIVKSDDGKEIHSIIEKELTINGQKIPATLSVGVKSDSGIMIDYAIRCN